MKIKTLELIKGRFMSGFHPNRPEGQGWPEFLGEVYETGFQQGADNRDEQVRSWYTLPIKDWKLNGTGPIGCDKCGGALYKVRAKHPYPPEKALEGRLICPTCAIEILEGIYDNLYPNNQAKESTPNPNERIAGGTPPQNL